MIQRKEYLNQLIQWKDEKVIKVVTGIRRCGKSTLLELYQQHLRSLGVSDDQIVAVNFEDLDNEPLLDYKELYRYLKERLLSDRMTYIFLDEIQKVAEFEKVVNSLNIKANTDIYITGSNAYLLSGELATLLSGRYIAIHMLPLSFAEFCEIRGGQNYEQLFTEYMRLGSFPYIASLTNAEEKVDTYLEGLYNTIIIKDIEEREKRKKPDPNRRKVTDLTLLRNLARFLAGAVGSPISMKRITDYVTSSGRKVSQSTIGDYVKALEEPYIFYPVERYDVVGKQLLKTSQKIYIVDLGIRRYLLPRRNYDLGFSLENLVYLELLRREGTVNVGKVGLAEIDFVVAKNDRLHYIQVTASMTDESTFQREIAPLRSVNDNYPKTILTLDRFTIGNYDGIEVVNVIDWLLNRQPIENAAGNI